jgi:hypothetical protein
LGRWLLLLVVEVAAMTTVVLRLLALMAGQVVAPVVTLTNR